MTTNLVLTPPEADQLIAHLEAWQKWRQRVDDLTADNDWDQFIVKSREKAQWQAGLAADIDRWENLHAIQLALEERLGGSTHRGVHTHQ